MTFDQKQLNFKIEIVKIGKEFPYIQKVEKLVRKSPINFKIVIVRIGKEFPYIQKVQKLVRKSPINFQNRNCKNLSKSGSMYMTFWPKTAQFQNRNCQNW